MLRRKLVFILLTLTGTLLLLAVVALGSLREILTRQDQLAVSSGEVIDRSYALNTTISTIEGELRELESGRKRRLDGLIESVEQLQAQAVHLSEHPVMGRGEGCAACESLLETLAEFRRSVGALATVQDPLIAERHNRRAVASAARLRDEIVRINRFAQTHVQGQQADLTGRLRWLVIGIGLAFLLVLDLSVVLMLRGAALVLRPLEKLIAATRELAAERFSNRVELDQHDEFGQLADAFNQLAQRLEHSEQRGLETLGQAALTLNHELNNAIAIVECQLRLLRRKDADEATFEKRLKQIHDSMQRMARTVESLKHVRRIVLTDYVGGEKMLDLERSMLEEGVAAAPRQSALRTGD